MSALMAAEQHGPRGAAHLVLLAGVVVIAIAVIGVNRWRARRDEAAAGEEPTTSRDQRAESTQSTEDE
jgi:uncharacterized iron-regulated membrane protein